MTPAECIWYCSANNWSYAGVEYGGECWCDEYLHQVGFQETASSNCDMPCNGDATQTCGGPNLIDVYWNGDFEQEGNPVTLSRSFWSFAGCFVDSVTQRTFPAQVQAVGGVYPPSCADACAFYGYTMMGTEYGDECWCGNSTGTASQAPDTDCVMTCSADRDYYCGNANRLSVYQNNPPAETYTNECLAGPLPSWLNVTRLSILASPKQPSTLQTGWNGAVLRIIDVLTVGDTTWSLLSACQNCNITWIDLSFGNNTDPEGFLVPTTCIKEKVSFSKPKQLFLMDTMDMMDIVPLRARTLMVVPTHQQTAPFS
ncbi:copper radical oxidase [Lentinula edodes]|uniref:Copper radical oxidase n=1 Tax=Lentinula edodes TaxID=5353 RepID=A0A1Q3ECQ0_LENED|nr:copper radical oxidase [Lentinula edodes]